MRREPCLWDSRTDAGDAIHHAPSYHGSARSRRRAPSAKDVSGDGPHPVCTHGSACRLLDATAWGRPQRLAALGPGAGRTGLRSSNGVTGLEMAIILIAFVSVDRSREDRAEERHAVDADAVADAARRVRVGSGDICRQAVRSGKENERMVFRW